MTEQQEEKLDETTWKTGIAQTKGIHPFKIFVKDLPGTLLLIKESLYQNPLVSPLLNNVSWSKNRKSQGVDGMFNKVRDPCSLERISRTPGRDFPGHLCL